MYSNGRIGKGKMKRKDVEGVQESFYMLIHAANVFYSQEAVTPSWSPPRVRTPST